MVFDEAMSVVDQQSEALTVRVLEEFPGHRIVSAVHRLNMVRGFDTIAMLEGGRIVEAGARGELLQRQGGRFRALRQGPDWTDGLSIAADETTFGFIKPNLKRLSGDQVDLGRPRMTRYGLQCKRVSFVLCRAVLRPSTRDVALEAAASDT